MKKLERSLSLPYVVAIAIGGMLGSGLFVLPGLAAYKTGSSVWLAYLIGAICVLPAALSKSELATAMPTSGGTYVYIERAFGPMMGTISGIGLWLSLVLKSSFALVGFAEYLYVLTDKIEVKIISLLMLSLILVVNIFGVKKVGKVQLIIVVISLIGITTLFFFGIFEIQPRASSEPFLSHGYYGLFAATGFIFVSYAGVTKVAAIAEEIKNPNRNLPLSMMSALFLIGAVYAAITFVLVGVVPISDLGHDHRPIYTLANTLGGYTAGILAAVLGIVTLGSMANSGVLAASRFPFAMSRDDLLPKVMKRVHPKHLTPFVTIIMTCVVMAIIILTLDVEKIAKLASAFMVMMFIFVNAAVIVLRETGVQWYKPSYKAPLYPIIQLFGIISGIILLILLGVLAIAASIAIVVVGILVFYAYGRRRASRKGVLRLYGHRPALFLLSAKNTEEAQRTDSKDLLKSANLDGALAENAEVVVPLFGSERSAEMTVEIGGAFSNNNKIQVVHLTEVPEQTFLDAIEDDVRLTSLNRRLDAMSKVKSIDLDFDAAATHDIVKTLSSISLQTHCKWLVMGWSGRSSAKGILVQNPLGWVIRHIDCNFALFKDNGVRYIKEICLSLSPEKQDAKLVKYAKVIAKYYNAKLTILRVVTPNGPTIEAVQRASEELVGQFQMPISYVIKEAKNPIKEIINQSASFDLLIIGTPEEENFRTVLLGKKDKLAEEAACSVLRLTIKH
jgi:APA family basic amino acid/polyamine antiporter